MDTLDSPKDINNLYRSELVFITSSISDFKGGFQDYKWNPFFKMNDRTGQLFSFSSTSFFNTYYIS